ncbi:MAG: FkbM family methyltransferase, partial [Stellaceae bacterium]
ADTGLSRLADGGGTPVILRRLDTIVAEARLARLDLVKIDVEGHERAVLAGAEAVLRRFRPAIVFESGHETTGDRTAIAALLVRLGYQLVAVLHDYGALACTEDDYRNAASACAGSEARNILALPRPG